MRVPLPVADYLRLTRPGIVAMVLLAMLVAALVSGDAAPAGRIANVMGGTALVIVGAIALNQLIERWTDARMARTAPRPLPSGRLGPLEVAVFGAVTSAAGLAWLAALGDRVVLVLAAVSWTIYVLIYTPLKPRTGWQTPVGAVAGAMPVLLGAAAAGAASSVIALTLFAVIFFWQFPHAMAIAWLYREQFRRAGLRVWTVTDPSGRRAPAVALLGAVALLPVSLAPFLLGSLGKGYAVCAVICGLAYLEAAYQFYTQTEDRWARRLLRMSLVYLVALLAALVWARWA